VGTFGALLKAALASSADDPCDAIIQQTAAVGIMYMSTMVSLQKQWVSRKAQQSHLPFRNSSVLVMLLFCCRPVAVANHIWETV
jgi:hypothetical protein